jgi:hypothetical protein
VFPAKGRRVDTRKPERKQSEAERAERGLSAASAAADDSPGAAAQRLEALFAEAKLLLPRVVRPTEDLDALRTKLAQAQTLNQLWPRLFAAKTAMEAADALYGVSMPGNGVSQVISRRLPRESDGPALSAAPDLA